MKRFREALAWAGALLLVGVFLLLKNLDIFGKWGDLIWGALFVAVGLGFLIWFVVDLQRWWRAIPGFTLLGIGAWIILQWRNIALAEWSGALVLFAMALGFWAVALVRGEHWWSVIPAGVLTVLGFLFRFWSQLTDLGRMTMLVAGIGLVFALLYVIRFGQRDTRWAGVPAAALLLLGLVTLMQALNLPEVVATWWPLLLVVAGLGIGFGVLGLRGAARPAAPAAPGIDDAAAPAQGASVTGALPEAPVLPAPRPTPQQKPTPTPVPETAVPQPAETHKAEPVDIYEMIKQQPAAAPSETAPSPAEPVVEPPASPAAGEPSAAEDKWPS